MLSFWGCLKQGQEKYKEQEKNGAKSCEGGQRSREAWTIREGGENQQRNGDCEKVHRENEKRGRVEWSWEKTTKKFLLEEDIQG